MASVRILLGVVTAVSIPEISEDGVDNDSDTLADADDLEDPPPLTTVRPDDTTETPELTIEPS